MEFFEGGPLFNFVSLMVSVVPLIAAFLLGRLAARQRLRCFSIAHTPGPNATESRGIVAVWNVGREPVRAADLAKREPLSLDVPGSIRGNPAVDATSSIIEPTYRPTSDSTGVFEFDFIEPGHGFYATFSYTGRASPPPSLKGYVIGEGVVRAVRPSRLAAKGARSMVAVMGAIGGIIGALLTRASQNSMIALTAGVLFACLWAVAAFVWLRGIERGRTLPAAIAKAVEKELGADNVPHLF